MVSLGKVTDRRKDSSSLRGPDLKLFVRDVRDRQGRKRAITVRSWSTIQDVKHVIQKVLLVPPASQKLYFGPLLSSGGELPNHRTLHDAGIYRSGEVLLLDIKEAGGSSSSSSLLGSLRGADCNDLCISSSMIDSCPRALRSLVQRARRGFLLGLKPEFVMDGSSGTYFLHDAKKVKIAVFKPADEEPYAENNPCGYLPQPGQDLTLREGVVPGEACIREVAAYLLDHDGFSGVPMTTLTEARHPAFNTNGARLTVAAGGASIGSHSISPSSSTSNAGMKKVGSFQEFAHCECTMDDISPSKISVDEVHKIAILDIRILNADRNSANLLVRRRRDNSLELVPIDHGFCLRSVSDVSWMDWCWLDWPQLKKPISAETKKYIMDLDVEADARLLHEQLNISSDAVDYFRASSRILKAGVQAGLTLYDIAIMCCRNDNMGEVPSKLEILFSMASDLSLSALENGRWHHSAASRALAEQLSPRGGPLIPSRHHSMVSLSRMLSKSATNIHQLDDEYKAVVDGTLDDFLLKKDYPGMIQSSASDSSSETGGVADEKEECDVWAAALLSNISMDQSMTIMKESRSPSIGSEDDQDENLSSSPKGFWHIRPGSPSMHSLETEDDDVSWNMSPEPSPVKPEFAPRVRPSQKFLELPESPLLKAHTEIHQRTTTVTFADEPWLDKELELPTSEQDFAQHVPFPDLPPLGKGQMTRSQSYSAISALNNSACEGLSFGSSSSKRAHRMPDAGTKEYEIYRDYFLKFTELVIVRETKAATFQSQMSDVSS